MKSLRWRLFMGFTGVLMAGLLGFGLIVWLLAREAMTRDTDNFLRDKALLLGFLMPPAVPQMEPWMESFMETTQRRYFIQKFSPSGEFMGKSSNLAVPLPLTEAARRSEHPAGEVVLETISGPHGEHLRLATFPRRDGWRGTLLLYSLAAVDLADLHDRQEQLLTWLVGGGLAVLAFGTGTAWFLSKHWLRSVIALEETARDISVGNLSKRRLFVPAEEPELAALARTFNSLLDRLEDSHTMQQRFAADASHELRTPLTILRGEIEVALRRPRVAEEYHAVLVSNREEIERLSRLTENLLALAHVDAGEAIALRDPVDIAEVCREIMHKLLPLAQEAGVSLTMEADASGDPAAKGDRLGLESIVSNLIENAVRYSPRGETVIVRVGRENACIKLDVADCGSGIAPEHLPHIFERFYRVDKVRARAHGGAGLGLAIVEALVQAHGGEITVHSVVGLGSIFTVLLPAAHVSG